MRMFANMLKGVTIHAAGILLIFHCLCKTLYSSKKVCVLVLSSVASIFVFSLNMTLALWMLISFALMDLFLVIGVHWYDVEGVIL